MTRIELCTDGLEPQVREAILDVIYQELHISPGEVSSDGNYELDFLVCGEPMADAPYLRIDGMQFGRVTPERVRDLIRGGKRRT